MCIPWIHFFAMMPYRLEPRFGIFRFGILRSSFRSYALDSPASCALDSPDSGSRFMETSEP